ARDDDGTDGTQRTFDIRPVEVGSGGAGREHRGAAVDGLAHTSRRIGGNCQIERRHNAVFEILQSRPAEPSSTAARLLHRPRSPARTKVPTQKAFEPRGAEHVETLSAFELR